MKTSGFNATPGGAGLIAPFGLAKCAPDRQMVNRRSFAMVAVAVVAPFNLAVAAPATLPAAVSLPDELALALKRGESLVVMVSLPGCPYCKITRENYLGPMHAQDGLSVVQVDMQSRQRVKNFDGAFVTHEQLIEGWGIKIAPTLLFFGASGKEIVPRLEGIASTDFYGAYLDERLAQARRLVQSAKTQ